MARPYVFEGSPFVPHVLPGESATQAIDRTLREEYELLKQETDKKEAITLQVNESLQCYYRLHPNQISPVAKAAMLKLLSAELEFLNKFASASSNTVVYACTTDDLHVQVLATWFPTLNFKIYDPRKFTVLPTAPNLEVFDRLFDLDEAEKYYNQKILFVCTVRPEQLSKNDAKEAVRDDMLEQRALVRGLKPLVALLKFVLPFKPGQTRYLDGVLQYGIFNPTTSTEFLLTVFDMESSKTYDNQMYEKIAYYHNNMTRTVRRADTQRKEEWLALGIDFCWDCCAFLSCLRSKFPVLHNDELLPMVADLFQLLKMDNTLKIKPHGAPFETGPMDFRKTSI
jgi:hypothetical protein